MIIGPFEGCRDAMPLQTAEHRSFVLTSPKYYNQLMIIHQL
jgi:hypothetical protein